MSTITIQIIDIVVESVEGKDYKKAVVTFKTSEGKVEAKTVMSFVNESVWESIIKSQKGDWFDIEREKDKTGKYWNWVGIHRQTAPQFLTPIPPTFSSPKVVNTYEQKNKLDQERFKFDQDKQILIIRQSCISSAVAYMSAFGKGTTFSPDHTIEVARQFENYVLGSGVANLVSDPV